MPRRDHALDLARRGFRVFPLASAENGVCTCGSQCGKNAGKHPHIKNWQHDATTDEAQIRRWWHRWPLANIGLATGEGSGVIVIDVDPEKGGEESLLAWRKLPDTVESLTGGGGRHIFLRHPGVPVHNKQSWDEYPGLDIRGDGGYVVAPGSVHRSGREYEWEASSHPDDVELAELPEWLLQLLTGTATAADAWNGDNRINLVPVAPILQGCAWLRHCSEDAPTLGYGPWYAMLTIVSRVENGRQLAHDWSKAHPNYRPEETDSFFIRAARGESNPRGCQDIRHNLDGERFCSGCPHWGRIKSPIVLGGQLHQLDLAVPPRAVGVAVLDDAMPVDPDPLPQEIRRPFARAGEEPATHPEPPTTIGSNGHATESAGRPVESNGDRPNGSRGHHGEMTLEQALVTAKLACSQVRDDPGVVYAEDVLYALALLRNFDKQNWVRLKKIITGAKVALSELLPMFPAVTLAASDRAEHLQDLTDDDLPIEGGDVQFAGDMLDDCPNPLLRIPDAYRLTPSATVRLREDAEGAKTPHVVAFAPVLITGRLQDAVTAQESLLASWRWPGQGWRSEVIRRGQAMNGRQLATLADIGFPVADDNLKDLVGYLHRLEAWNRRRLPCAAVSAHLGWQGEDGERGFLVGRTLVHPDGQVEPAGILDTERPETWSEKRIAFHGLSEGDEQIVDAFHARGTWDGWLDTVKQLAPYPKALVCFYAGFAPPLLALLGVPNFILDIWNRTTTGKTTSVRSAASIWGNPDERCPDSVIAKWNASKVYVERASHVLSGLPLILDDTKEVRQPQHVAEIIYAVASGRGRGRGTIQGLARTVSFRTVLLSTGEQPAVSFGQDGGARTRTIEIAGMPFGAANAETAGIVARLNAGFAQNYGHAGTRFLQWLMRARQDFTPWQERYQKGVMAYSERPPSPEAGRLAAYAALISLAGMMAHEALELPWKYTDPMWHLWEDVASEAADAAGEVRAMQDVLSFASSRTTAFSSLAASGTWRQPPANSTRLGRWDVTNAQWEFLAFFPTELRTALRGFGYDYDPIIAGWKERGWIQVGKDGKPAVPTKPGDGESATRMVRILRAAVEEINPADPEPEVQPTLSGTESAE